MVDPLTARAVEQAWTATAGTADRIVFVP